LNKELLNIEVQDFIKKYKKNIAELFFLESPFQNVTIQELIQQIESRSKIEKKLPTWYHFDGIYYPPKLNLEQTSSEITAKYKASLLKGSTLADLTGGFGIDSFYFSEVFKKVYHFEHNSILSKIAAHNFKVLKKHTIQCVPENGMEWVAKEKYDVIYVDPSRRHDSKGKVFLLKDCEPNIPENLTELLNGCDLLLLKTSPMLDITAGLNELNSVFQIHIVAVENEVRELLWFLKKGFEGAPEITTINLTKRASEKFEFKFNQKAEPVYSLPQRFLYEPNAALMKSGVFNLLSEAFKINKLHRHTHLYTSNMLCEFPGRRFLIEKVIPYSKSTVRKELTIKKANISTRNFPENVATLQKKWNIKDGGDHYLFFITVEKNQKVVLVCSKV
jgi:hypothetical protein